MKKALIIGAIIVIGIIVIRGLFGGGSGNTDVGMSTDYRPKGDTIHERMLGRKSANLERTYTIRGVTMAPMDYTLDQVLDLIGKPLETYSEPDPLGGYLAEYYYEDYVLLIARVNPKKGGPYIVWDIYCK